MRKSVTILLYSFFGIAMLLCNACDKNSPTSPEPNGVEIEMATIPAGSFRMGSNWENDPDNPEKGYMHYTNEQPVHTVTLNSFHMSITEITQAQYTAVIGTNPSYFEGEDLPVEQVSWVDAIKFCNRLSESHGLKVCYDEQTYECDFSKNGYRLPTEAEWEYACRAGTTTQYYTGNDARNLKLVAWFNSNSQDMTHPVGQKKPNVWGLYDLNGNVSEWCHDWYDTDYYDYSLSHNPTGPETSYVKILRGGSYSGHSSYNRSAYRDAYTLERRRKNIGFRIVRNG